MFYFCSFSDREDQFHTPVQESSSADSSANALGAQACPSQNQVQASGDNISAGRNYGMHEALLTYLGHSLKLYNHYMLCD